MIAFPDWWAWFALSGTIWLTSGLVAAWALKRHPGKAHSLLVAASLGALISPFLWIVAQRANWGLLPPTQADPIANQPSIPSDLGASEPFAERSDQRIRPADEPRSKAIEPATAPATPLGMPVAIANRPKANQTLTEPSPKEPAGALERERSSPESAREVSGGAGREFPWYRILLWGWIGWSLLSVCKLLWDFLLTRIAVSRCAEPSNPSLQESLQRAAVRLGVSGRLPRMGHCDFVGSPSLWAWSAHPVILVGPDFSQDAGADAIFCHELAHWSRGDHWGALLGEVLFCILPWHPLAWWTRRSIKRFSEEACDDWAIECGCPAVDYAEALLAIASGKSPRLALAAVSFRSHLGDRVRRILAEGFRPRKALRSWLVGAGIATALLLVIGALLRHPNAVHEFAGDADTRLPAAEASVADSKETAAGVAQGERTQPESTTLTIVDEAGAPIVGAQIKGRSHFYQEMNGKKSPKSEQFDRTTGADGAASFALPKDHIQSIIHITKEGYISVVKYLYLDDEKKDDVILSNYKIVLEKGVNIGGKITDENNRPINGAKINIHIPGAYNYNETSFGPLKTLDGAANYSQGWEAVTDADGRWKAEHFPKHPLARAFVSVSHPDFLSKRVPPNEDLEDGKSIADLLAQKLAIRLASGFRIQGKVTDPNGKPIEGVVGATTTWDAHYRNTVAIQVDSSGNFRSNVYEERGDIKLSIVAPGYAPQTKTVRAGKGALDQRITLHPRGPVRIRLVDTQGRPVPDVVVQPGRDYSANSILGKAYIFSNDFEQNNPAPTSDQKGEWTWTWPSEERNEIQIGEREYRAAGKRSWVPLTVSLNAGDPQKIIVLEEIQPITGRVTDERTGKPVPHCSVIEQSAKEGSRNQWHWYSERILSAGKEGEFSLEPGRSDLKLRLRIQAPGYLAQDGPEFQVGGKIPSIQNFALKPAPTIRGAFLDPAGKTIGKLGFYLATRYKYVIPGDRKNCDYYTDENGRFSFDAPNEPFTLLVRSSHGSFTGNFSAGKTDLGNLVLMAPARLKGILLFNKEPVARTSVELGYLPLGLAKASHFREPTFFATTDAQGRFEFPSVAPGTVTVKVRLWNSEPTDCRSGPQQGLTLPPGKETEVVLGGNGIQVTGNIQIGGDRTKNLSEAVVHLYRRNPRIPGPSPVAIAWFSNFCLQAGEGSPDIQLKYLAEHQHWVGKVTKEGDFHLSGITEGEYDLQVVNDPYSLWERPFYANFVRKVTITPEDARAGKLHLPIIQGPSVPQSPEGSRPDLSFIKADGQKGSLADFRGGFLFVAFRSPWSYRSDHFENTLEDLSKKFAAERIRILEIDIDEQSSKSANAAGKILNPTIRARLAAQGDFLWYAPHISWLVDPKGTVLAISPDTEDIEKVLRHFKK